MSRIGNMPVTIPSGVTVSLQPGTVKIKGPKGEISRTIPAPITVRQENSLIRLDRPGDSRSEKSLHGLSRALIANMVEGVTKGFERKLEIYGVGYRAAVQGHILQLELGLSHVVRFPIPAGITVEVEKQGSVGGMPMTPLTIRGVDNILVGDVAAKLRSLRPPEPYQGKGVRYASEHVRRKVGKKAS